MTLVKKRRNMAVKVVTDGTHSIDGGRVNANMDWEDWVLRYKPNRKNKIRLGLNCLLIQSPWGNILINTGMGNRFPAQLRSYYGHTTSKLNASLKLHKVSRKDIDLVYFTSAHFHVMGGAVKIDKEGEPFLNFSNADHLIQENAWEELKQPGITQKDLYGPDRDKFMEEIKLIEAENKLKLINGNQEISPGVSVELAEGFSNGHSITKVNAGSDRYTYLADLVPTADHVHLPCITAWDRRPDDMAKAKSKILSEAQKEGHMLIFSHGTEVITAYITPSGAVQPVKI